MTTLPIEVEFCSKINMKFLLSFHNLKSSSSDESIKILCSWRNERHVLCYGSCHFASEKNLIYVAFFSSEIHMLLSYVSGKIASC